MFMASRAATLEGLQKMGVQRCAYSWGETWADRCDCKYGMDGGEATGCPELRSLHTIVGAMTDEEWAMLMARTDGVPSGMYFGATAETIQTRLYLALGRIGGAIECLNQASAQLTLEREVSAETNDRGVTGG